MVDPALQGDIGDMENGPRERRNTQRQLLDPSAIMNLVPEATQESYMPTENEPGQPVFLPTE